MLELTPLGIPEPQTVYILYLVITIMVATIVGKQEESKNREPYLQFVHVNLDELDISVFDRELFEGRLDESTRSAPCCGEINHQLQHQKNK